MWPFTRKPPAAPLREELVNLLAAIESNGRSAAPRPGEYEKILLLDELVGLGLVRDNRQFGWRVTDAGEVALDRHHRIERAAQVDAARLALAKQP